jgi:hypothetical protein
MMPYQSYQLWQIERPKTPAEQYAADMRGGMFAAAVSRSARRAVSKTVRAAAGSRLLLARAVRLNSVGSTARCEGLSSINPGEC